MEFVSSQSNVVNIPSASITNIGSLPQIQAKKLLAINLRDNEIKKIEGLNHLSHCLEFLDLSCNSITFISGLNNFASLRFLDLSSNRLSSLNGLTPLISLVKLVVPFNRIHSIRALEHPPPHLRFIDFRANLINNLELKDLESCTELVEVLLQADDGSYANPCCAHKSYWEFMNKLSQKTLQYCDGRNLKGKKQSHSSYYYDNSHLQIFEMTGNNIAQEKKTLTKRKKVINEEKESTVQILNEENSESETNDSDIDELLPKSLDENKKLKMRLKASEKAAVKVLEDTAKEIETFQFRIDEYEKENNKLRRESETTKKDIELLQKEKDDLMIQATKFSSYRNEIERLHSQLVETNHICESYEKRIRSERTRSKTIKEMVIEWSESLPSFLSKLSIGSENLSKLSNRLEICSSKAKFTQIQIQSLMNVEAHKRKFQNKEVIMKMEIEMETTIAKIEEQAKNEIENCRVKELNVINERNKLIQQNKAIKSVLKDTETENNNLRNELFQMRENEKKMLATLEEFEQAIKLQKNKSNKKIKSIENEYFQSNEDLKGQLELSNHKISVLEAAIADEQKLRFEYEESLQIALEELKNKNEIKKQNEEAKQRIDEFEEERKQLTKELERTKTLLNERENRIRELSSTLNEIDEKNDMMTTQFDSHFREIAEEQTTIAKELSAKLASKDEEEKYLKKKNSSLKKKLESLTSEFENALRSASSKRKDLKARFRIEKNAFEEKLQEMSKRQTANTVLIKQIKSEYEIKLEEANEAFQSEIEKRQRAEERLERMCKMMKEV